MSVKTPWRAGARNFAAGKRRLRAGHGEVNPERSSRAQTWRSASSPARDRPRRARNWPAGRQGGGTNGRSLLAATLLLAGSEWFPEITAAKYRSLCGGQQKKYQAPALHVAGIVAVTLKPTDCPDWVIVTDPVMCRSLPPLGTTEMMQ